MVVPEQLRFHDDDLHDLLENPPTPAQLRVVDERRANLDGSWAFDPEQRWLDVWTFVAAVPDARARHAARGVPDDVSWASLRDLGRHTHLDRLLHGTPGLRKSWWVQLPFNGLLFELGRLQFELRRRCLNVHIPEAGPLDPGACDESFARARALLPDYGRYCCTSWLLDPQLAEYLPPDSNILRFQRRFEATGDAYDADDSVIEFVFHRLAADVDLDDLPQRTTLERAVVAHLRSGRHWRAPTGCFAL